MQSKGEGADEDFHHRIVWDNSSEGVPIPRSTIILSGEQFQQLQNLVTESADYGIDLYQEVVQYLDTIL